ncbi:MULTISPECIES: hypothetical protein [unclassified Endozoicomonas]|uniref:hypothetical protein n=1 Tax=unclassified Endozoicomonas TaxID=2644528 RepID=UPI002075EAE5|nr:hypothetical protein [Endozoicomonas sp. SCSIO W0465]USE35861.1 hypothetical protein MJO57_27995 [Endozoicomonas sp. SCSIO W0465]
MITQQRPNLLLALIHALRLGHLINPCGAFWSKDVQHQLFALLFFGGSFNIKINHDTPVLPYESQFLIIEFN